MDEEEDYVQQLKWIFIAGFIFLGSGYASLTEFRFLIWGRPIDAMIERAQEDVNKNHVTLYYRFTDTNGQERLEQDTVAVDWNVPRQGPLHIQYISGSKTSRIAGHSNATLVYVFLISLAALVGAIYWLCRLANQPIRRSGSRRRR